ncbi:MAG TPA: hypothetical protein VLX30_02690 [Burkholderiales bacterium]|nr:hypothetical protein [Burkholderiales bacterium]
MACGNLVLMPQSYDRAAEDLGNVVALEHVNTWIPDQQLATAFYISALGLTRDPYLMTGTDNMWANVGRSQFHLPSAKPQVLRGRVGIVLPGREALLARLARARKPLEGTRFAFAEHEGYVETVSPWGNVIRCHDPHPGFGRMRLGMPYVELDVPPAAAEGIARFYRQIVGAPARHEDGVTRVSVGPDQVLIYRETERKLPPYDGHHVQIYLADFSGPYLRLLERGLVSEESDQHQYRFTDLVDPANGKKLFVLEHEVRSMRHPLYARPLVNRDPAQSNVDYAPGYDATPAVLPRAERR